MSTPRVVAFGGVSAVGMAAQVITIAGLAGGLGVDYRVATTAGVGLALVHNFAWHRRWTWADRAGSHAPVLPAFGRFVLANGLVSLVGNLLLMRWLVGAMELPVVPANLLAIAACGVVNFWLADRHVFRAVA